MTAIGRLNDMSDRDAHRVGVAAHGIHSTRTRVPARSWQAQRIPDRRASGSVRWPASRQRTGSARRLAVRHKGTSPFSWRRHSSSCLLASQPPCRAGGRRRGRPHVSRTLAACAANTLTTPRTQCWLRDPTRIPTTTRSARQRCGARGRCCHRVAGRRAQREP